MRSARRVLRRRGRFSLRSTPRVRRTRADASRVPAFHTPPLFAPSPPHTHTVRGTQQSVTFYGPPEARAAARAAAEAALRALAVGGGAPPPAPGAPAFARAVMWATRAQRAAPPLTDLARFRSEHGLLDARVEGATVRLWGPPASVERARGALALARAAAAEPPSRSPAVSEDHSCPVCWEEYSEAHPALRLAACGHSICAACVAAHVATHAGAGGGLLCPADGCGVPLAWADAARDASAATLAVLADAGAARLRRRAGTPAAALRACVNRACSDLLEAAAGGGGGGDAAAQAAAGGAQLARCAAEGLVYCVPCSDTMNAAVPAHRDLSCAALLQRMRLDASAAEGEIVALRRRLEESFAIRCPNCVSGPQCTRARRSRNASQCTRQPAPVDTHTPTQHALGALNPNRDVRGGKPTRAPMQLAAK
jgi:hypothetical protein